ncbi:ATP-binding protein [Leptolyngbya sp. CCY15150]|uniref:DEAD/DEAH box helicase n=1 Tax=Leptolyngbya sp. CCY15150 TaxID=2767772 RepID=UPI00195121F8|nr:ATP-binding protein [Leptolyngbya sp. CCY15150]
MTEQDKQWFDALTKDRADSSKMLEKPSMRGVQRSVVDKYSDQAHFIYELLQNADDVKATTATFRLGASGLCFTHNGSVRFTVSNPQNEEVDTHNGTLGHINAITSIANSNKTQASIGKFGVGFKAVFQYTQTPHIYDPKIQFKIERFIVPHRLDSDLDWRKASETVFFFPFDHQEKQPQESHDEILEKLKALEFPVLFLSNLESVSFEAEKVTGKYTKEVTREIEQGDITVQWITLTLVVNGETTSQNLLMFTRNSESGHPCSIGYGLGENGRIMPIDRPAFCFFPTKEVTNLNFLLHAPFLLTDSREGIKAGKKHNQELVQQLAQLAADSLPILRDEKLIDDGILNIIPYDETRFSALDDRRRISFEPFFTAIKHKLQTDTLLPAANGECSPKSCSYWAFYPGLVELFSDEHLAQLTGTQNAHWVFRGLGREEVQRSNKPLADYIDGGTRWSGKEPNLIVSSLDPEVVLKKITADFIAAQSQQWLHKLYAYLSERASYQRFVKDKPIFLDQEGNAVPAFDDGGHHVLFLPDDDIEGYITVKKDLLSDKDTREFIEKFGIKKPSLRDEIYNKILPTYSTDEEIDTSPHFKKFFRYFKECKNNEVSKFIDLIKDKEFLLYVTVGDDNVYRGMAEDVYLPTQDLEEWFETKPDTQFLRLDEYHEMVDKEDYEILYVFFEKLGVSSLPKVIHDNWTPTKKELHEGNLSTEGRNHNLEDKILDGCEEIISDINKARSLLLWRMLPRLIQKLSGRHTWFYYYSKDELFISTEEQRLLSAQWILNKTGELVSADAVTIQTLSDEYDKDSERAKALIEFLEIQDEAHDTAHLSEEEVRKIELADKIAQLGLSEDEILVALEDAKRKKSVQPSRGKSGRDRILHGSTLMQEIENRRPSVKHVKSSGHQESDPTPSAQPNDANEDADDYTPKTVNYGKKLDRAKDRYASELDRLEHEQALHDKANALPRYSYGWFLALLELECMASSEKNADGKTISIRFGKVESDSQSSRSIVLKEPSRFIPQSIEEFSGVRVDLDFGNGRTGKLHIESFTAREFSLLGKLVSADELSGIDLGEVLEARIEVQNPSFLLQELLERLRELGFDEKFGMKESLTPDIEFVFGPPGTGKTTHLAEKILIPMMQGTEPTRVLVLTPTNKAADVLTTRIIEKMGTDTSYLNWLVRFGTSADERIEKAGVWRDRSFDIGTLSHSVTVTTIARFAYDGFAVKYGSKKLYETEWDAIVIDEASMISLSSIIYPLYRQKPGKFIVAGDPFQIEPIVAVEQWKDENIYTLVGLNKAGAFAKPATEPHNYSVTNLETQYRSIPAIGEIFSRFTYDGILKHHRTPETQRPLNLNNIDVQPINLIKFPVSKYESIYRAKRLESGTPYQTYSALFTFEFVRWLAGQIQVGYADKFRIGVIAPYRAQANLLSRLNDSWASKPNGVEIQVGTIHGFQGDECDIIIAVFNPPPSISTSPQMFLNKQNILNVAISRARDYLFIVMPDDETEGVRNLYKIAKLEGLVKKPGDAFVEHASSTIEEMIWGNANYLEENTFSTGHQMVNVYRKPERYYEVRSDDSAIDVQIHEKR